jgi:excisionase family DNA binding protein
MPASHDKKLVPREAPSRVLTVPELCDYLRISRSTLYRLIGAGKLPWFKMGSDYRFNRETIDRWRQLQESANDSAEAVTKRRKKKT